MKRHLITLGITVVALLTLSSEAGAAAIGFRPASQTVTVGNPLLVDLYVDLGADTALGLGAFDLTLTFDPSMLAFGSYQLCEHLGAVDDVESSDFSLGAAGTTLNLAHLSFLAPSALTALQAGTGGSFTLATLQFTTLAVGRTSLDFIDVVLASIEGGSVGLDGVPTFGVQIQSPPDPAPIPEPASLVLMGTGLAALAARRRLRRAPHRLPDSA